MSAITGKEIQKMTHNSVKLRRVSLLDPAGPAFLGPFVTKFDKHDADFVVRLYILFPSNYIIFHQFRM